MSWMIGEQLNLNLSPEIANIFRAHFSVVTGKTQVIEWSNCLDRAASAMKVLLDGTMPL